MRAKTLIREHKMTPRISKISVHNLMLLADTYCKHCGIISTTLSRDILSDAPALDKIRTGKGSTSLRKFDQAMEWFDQNWPDDLPWPKLEAIPGMAQSPGSRATGGVVPFAGAEKNGRRVVKRRTAR